MQTTRVAPATDDPVIRALLKHPPRRAKAKVKKTKPIVWAIDFDGTVCKNWYPNIGPPRRDVIDVLKFAQQNGVLLVFWSCREGALEKAAIDWCAEQGLVFDAVNDNPPEAVEFWGVNPRKIGADLYLDDKAFNAGESLCELMNHVIS